MSTLIHRRFKFPKSCNVRELVLRETNGIDEQAAALAAEARAGRSSIYQELVRLSIVEVDGAKVIQPYAQLEQWNSRTRALVQEAYKQLNDLKEEELSVFLAASEDATPGQIVAREEESPAEDAVTPLPRSASITR